MRLSLGHAVVGLCFGTLLTAQVVPGPNVNMVSGTTWPDGDPFLQRQNEPSIAVSSVNPQHLLAGANDYRTTDLELDPGKAMADAWLGVFKSYDGGLTWRSTLLPGCPYTADICNVPSALKPSGVAFQFSADPTVRPGTHGWLYYSGIAANRTGNNLGVVFVSRFYDYNNSEAAGGDPIQYRDTSIIDRGTSGQFQDKPWLAADSGEGSGRSVSCTLPTGGTVDSGRVYLAYSTFTGSDNNIRSKVAVAVSTNCGQSWSLPVKLSESNNYNLGTTLAVDPRNGAIYVAWRRVAAGNEPDAILIAKSTDFGNSWSKAVEVARINPFDIVMSGRQFRHRSFPTLAVSVSGSSSRVHLAWAENGAGPGGDARIVVTTSGDGISWPPKPSPIPACTSTTTFCMVDDKVSPSDPLNSANSPDSSGRVRGHQFMPALTFAAGKLMLVYYDLRHDSTIGSFTLDLTKTRYIETRRWAGGGTSASPDLATVFTPLTPYPAPFEGNFAVSDATPGLKRRHIVDVRSVQGLPGNPPAWGSSVRVSRYAIGYRRLPASQGGGLSGLEQIEFNAVNLPMFRKGTYPFMGDYIDVAARLFKPGATATAPYIFNTDSSTTEVFHTTWTDNRDVRIPRDGNWANYVPPISRSSLALGPTSLFVPNQLRALCDSTSDPTKNTTGQTGIRNQNIYTARITQRLVVSALANTKTVLAGQQRSFVVYVQNATDDQPSRTFTLTADAGASFTQFTATPSVVVTVPRLSTVSRTVFVTPSGSSLPRVTVTVKENGSTCTTDCPSVVLNDAAANPDSLSGETFVPRFEKPDEALGAPDAPLITSIAPGAGAFPNLGVPSLSGGDPTLAGGDPTVAGGDPTLAGGDPTVAGGDPTLAGGDPSLSGGDPSLSGGDPTLAGGDPTLAGGDPTLAGGDPTLAGGDSAIADVTWLLKQGGNSSGSFTVKPFQKGAQLCCPVDPTKRTPGCAGCILNVHKLYPLPTVATNSCTLAVRTQNVVLSSTRNPSFSTDGNNLTATGSGDPAVPLAGQGSAFVTLRTLFPSGSAPDTELLKSAARPVTVSQSVNSAIAATASAGCATAGTCPPSPVTLTIIRSVLPVGSYGTQYSFLLTRPDAVIGGDGNLTWTFVSGSVPGLAVGSCTVAASSTTVPCLTGTPTAAGTFTFKLNVVDTSGQSDSQTMTLTVAKAILRVTAHNKTRAYGDANPTLTGTILGLINNDPITATYTTTAVVSSPVGAYDITPVLSDPSSRLSNYSVTITNGTLTITKATTTTAITSALPDPSVVGQAVTVSVTVTPQFSGAPTGTVRVSGGGTICDATLASGSGSCVLSPTTVGNITLSASYPGDSNFNPSSGSATHKVVYNFIGFLSPLVTAGTVTSPSDSGIRTRTAGLPVKWQLLDASGAPIVKLEALTSLEARLNTLACPAPQGASPVVLFCSGNSCTGSTTYRYSSGQYVVNADMSALANACYLIVASFDDTNAWATKVQIQ